MRAPPPSECLGLVAATDPATGEVTDPAAIPACPRCGGEVFLNVRESADVVLAPYAEQAERLNAWLRAGAAASLLVLEIGAGYNTPGVIRWPLEHLVHHRPHARFVRVNPQRPAVPEEIASRSLAVRAGAAETIGALADPIVPTSSPESS